MKKKILSSLFVLLLLAATFYFWGSASTLDPQELNKVIQYDSLLQENQHNDTLGVISYNIGYLSGMTNNIPVDRTQQLFDDNLSKAVDLINQYNPDFIGFQEIDYGSSRSFDVDQQEEIAKRSGYAHSAMAVNWDKNYVPFPYWPPSMHFGKILSGQGVVSKFPIVKNELHTLAKPESNPFYYNAFYLERLAQVSTIEVGEQTLVIINVHLEAFDQPTREKHAQRVLKLYNQYAKDFPVLLMGDFNSIAPFATVRNGYEQDPTTDVLFKQAGMAAAIPEAQYMQNEKAYFTFSSGEPKYKIDYIFYNTDKITPIESTVIREAGEVSDHLPVWFKFVLKK